MRIVVAVKYVPVLRALRFDPVTRRLVREGVPGEPSAFDLRALEGALALRARHGGEVVALTMGPPAARAALLECLALGADRGVHLCDPALAGSDTLATARALAAALREEAADLVLLGRASVDAETGQVGPEVAELLDLPQATAVARLEIDPAARTFVAERETDDGAETVMGPLPALVTVGEDFAPERFPTRAERQAAAAKPIAVRTLAQLGLDPATVGTAGSPTWVAGLEPVEIRRRAEILTGESPAALARALGERLRALAPLRPEPPPLVARGPGAGDPVWVVAEAGPSCSRRRSAPRSKRSSSVPRRPRRLTSRMPGPTGCWSRTIRRSRPTPRRRTPPCSPRPSARAARGSCCSPRRCAAATSRRGWPRASASGSPAMRSTSTSMPRAASASSSPPSAARSWRRSSRARPR